MPERETVSRESEQRLGCMTHRPGPRPATTRVIPHRQLNQWPPTAIFERLLQDCLGLDEIREWESRMASPDTHALCIRAELAEGPAEAFIDDHEFCHIHPLPDGSLHLTLPSGLREEAIELDWAEPHLLAHTRAVPRTLVMVYAPRDDQELAMVLFLIAASARYAKGGRQ
jgi:hypothetical protein